MEPLEGRLLLANLPPVAVGDSYATPLNTPLVIDAPVEDQGTIRGTVRHDVNQDGVYEPSEPGLPGWTVYLDLNMNEALDPGEPSAVTLPDNPFTLGVDEAGTYALENVPPGAYTVAEVVQPRWEQTIPDIFGAADAYEVGDGIPLYDVASGDLDGDGDVDLVAGAFQTTDNLAILLNHGDGAFSAATSYEIDGRAISVALGDLDGDGDLDLAVANSYQSLSVSVLMNHGDGTFAAPVSHAVGADYQQSVVASDLDGDGDVDLAVGYQDGVSVLLNHGDGSFAAAVDYTNEKSNRGLVAGDMDGDGDVDLVPASRPCRMLLNDGNGLFSWSDPIGVSGWDSVAAEDLDNDGDLDLIFGDDGYLSNVVVAMNQGDGSFAPVWELFVTGGTMRQDPTHVVLGDLDGDGYADLVVESVFDNNLAVALNRGDGWFAEAREYESGWGNTASTLADFDGDGDLDLASVNEMDWRGLWIHENTWPYRLTLSGAEVVEGVDFGNWTQQPEAVDDAYDVVAGETLTVAAPGVLANDELDPGVSPTVQPETWPTHGALTLNSDGSFQYTPGPGFLGDDSFTYTIDDGLFVSEPATVTITVNPHRIISGTLRHDVNEDGVFEAGEPGLPGWTIYLDLNRNGRLDANEPSTLTLDDNPATPGENEAGRYSLIDEPPGDHTIAVATKPGWGTSTPDLFASPEHYRVPSPAGDDELMFFDYVISEDFDGDGDLDLALTDWDYKGAIVMLNRGDGSYAAPGYFPTPGESGHLAAADLDGDGDIDLVVAQVGTDSVSVMLNDGDGRFFWSAEYETGGRPSWVVAGDLDGDGDQDLAVANQSPDKVTVLRNDGSGSFTLSPTFAVGDGKNMALGDLDGDGDLDLVGRQWVLLNDGNGSFARGEGHSIPGSSPLYVALGDLDGDGDPDLAMTIETSSNRAVAILLNRGDGSFQWAASYVVASDWFGEERQVLQVADFDRDGDLDLVAAIDDHHLEPRTQLVLLRNHGDGSFAAPEFFPSEFLPVHATSGDFDGDQAPDVVVLRTFDMQTPLSFHRNIWPYRLTLTPGGIIEDVDFGVYRVPPLAVDDDYEVNEGETLVVATPGTLENDVYELNFVPDVSRDTDPTHGQLTLNADGSFTYTPEPGFVGVDTFTYTTDDGQFTSNVGTVSVNVKPWSTIRGTVWNDLDGSQFQEPGEPGLQGWQVFLDGSQNGTHELNEPIAATDSDGNYELASVRSGTHTVVQLLKPAWEQTSPSGSHSVALGAGQTEEGVDFGSRRVPPTAVDDAYHVDEDQSLAVPGPGVLANDVYDLDSPPVVELRGGPTHGSVTLNPDGSFLYSPEAGFFGPDSFTYVARDLPADSNVATVGIMVGGPSILTGSVWSDQNRNSLRDPGESSLEGWTVEFHTGAGNYPRTFQKPAPAEDDRFGSSIATLNGNVIVGAHGDSTGAPRAGAVYMFDGSTGELLRTFLNPTPESDDLFGYSVAVVGGNVLVGARSVDSGDHESSGEAYLFDGSTGALLHTFPNPDRLTYSNFGITVAAVGEKIFIAARATLPGSHPGARTGTVHMYDASTRAFVRTFHHPDPSNYDTFGCSMADVNGNVLIGSRGDAFLFDPDTGDLLHTFEPPTATAAHGIFGSGVAGVSGNILIGAPQADVGGKDSAGAAYLFDGSTYELLHTFLSPTPGSHEYFGASLAEVEGNVVFGTRAHAAFGGYSGGVFVFDGVTGELLETYAHPGPGSGERSEFGGSVAALGDKLLVAAQADDVGAPDGGAVYFFPRACQTTVTDALGHYRFTGVEPGTYEVRQAVEDGYSPTFPGGDGGHVVVIGAYEMVTDLDFASCFEEPPVAEDDDYRMHADTTLWEVAAGLLANDTDPNTDELTAVLVERPSHGTLALDGDGSFRYSPQAGFVGADRFTYRAHDGRLDSNVATVTITVETGPPEPVPFYFSLQNGGIVDGRNVANEDIVEYDGFRFRRYFDGSDVGLGDLAIDAVAVMSENEILMSFAEAGAVPGIADTVEAADLVKFTATQLGETTAGAFELFFDGSDVGLDAKGINVDAVETLEDGRLTSNLTTVNLVVPELLGRLSFRELDGQHPSAGDIWYQCTPTHDALLTLEAMFDAAAGTAQLTLYDENLAELTTSTLVGGNQRIDWQVDAGETYYFKLSGTNDDVDLRLANLVSHVGTEVTVYGTVGADSFEFDPAASRLVTINGVEYHFEDAEVTSATFDGRRGDDVALLHGDPNGPNRFEAWPGRAKLSGDDYTVQVTSVRYVHAYGHQGPADVALLHGDPNGPNQFEAWPHRAKLCGDDYFASANSFRYVHAYAGQGPADVALLHGDPNGPNRFEAWPHQAKLRGNGYFVCANSFHYVHAYANQGPADVAFLYGDPNGPNRFEAWPGDAKLRGDDYFARAKSFRYVHAHAYRSGSDEAILHDSALTDYLRGFHDWVTLHDAAYSFFYRAAGFDSVKAYSTTPSGDTKRVTAIDYVLDLSQYYWQDP